MRYSASEKFEIIELVEQSSLSIRRTLAPIGIPRSTFYDWYSRYQEGGIEALEDGKPCSKNAIESEEHWTTYLFVELEGNDGSRRPYPSRVSRDWLFVVERKS